MHKYILGIISILLLIGCQKENNSYITITNTCTVNENEYVMKVLRYDIYNQSLTPIQSIPYSSQYPLTLYLKQDNKIYYTALSKDKKGDELFVLENNSSKQLTNTFFAINNIYKIKEGLFIAGVKRGEDIVRPYIYDIHTNTIKDIPIRNDFYISCVSYNAFNGDLYVAGYLEKDEQQAFDNQDSHGNMKGICHYIYKYDDNSFKQIYKKENCYIKSIVSFEDDILIKYGTTYFDKQMKLSMIQNGKESSFPFKDNINSIAYEGLIYLDDNDIYYIRQFHNKYQLCLYHRDKQDIKVLYEAPSDSAINNATMICDK